MQLSPKEAGSVSVRNGVRDAYSPCEGSAWQRWQSRRAVESLKVSVAAGVCLDEALRQRSG